MRKIISTVTALALAVVLVACTPEEGSHLDSINALRAEHGLPALTWDEDAYAQAREWSEKLAEEGRLLHSTLSERLGDRWGTLGESVATNSTVQGAFDALMRSPEHLANMLDPDFTKVAIGIVRERGQYWVTQLFLG